ncbi:MAG: lysylphosphatidylglycerol synthase transmembrane domain-containing protein [Campylobacterota bacterium]|nr:lysylphosphatidylglycerol synthase transmembrane domain-containing protein [Campylobacterota bacterium]
MKNIIKLIITAVMFYFLFQYVDFQNLIHILAKSHGGTILIALLFQIGSTYLAAYRWRLIMRLLVFDESVSYYVKSYFKGTFFNQVLPSSIGGDAVRIIDLTQKGYDKKDAFYGIFVDRIVGLVGLLVLNLLATIIFYGTFDKDFSLLIILITLGGISGFAVLFHLEKITFLANYKFLNLFHRLARRLNSLYSDRTLLFKHIGISIGVHFLSVLTLYALALSIDFHISFQIFLIAVPPVFLLTIIPISLAGWGIREGAMIGIFMLVGADQTKVLAMSILYGLLLIISSFPGAYFWVKSKKAT